MSQEPNKEQEQNTDKMNPFLIFQKTSKPEGGEHAEVFLFEMIHHPFFYVDLLQFLYEATEDDTCKITIDNNGGFLTTGIALSEAIKRTKAHVTTKCVSIAASAAAVTFTPGHTKEAYEWGFLMYHTASYGLQGNTKEHREHVQYIEAIMQELMIEAKNENLITESDIDDIMVKARDVFISGIEVNNRIAQKETV